MAAKNNLVAIMRFLKTQFLVLLLAGLPISANAQIQDFLNKTHRQLLGSPTASSRLDSVIAAHAIVTDSIISSLQRYGLNAGNYANLASAINTATADTNDLVISKHYAISTTDTIPQTVRAIITRSGRINTSSGETLRIQGTIVAGKYQIFGGSGTVIIENTSTEVLPEWWGAKVNDNTDDAAAITKAIAATGRRATIRFGKGTYRLATKVVLPKASSLTKFFGDGAYSTTFRNKIGTLVDTMLVFRADSLEISNFRVVSNDSMNVGVLFDNSDFNFIHHVHVDSAAVTGIRFAGVGAGAKNNIVNSVRVSGCNGGGIVINASDNNFFSDTHVLFTRNDGITLRSSDGCNFVNCSVESNTEFGIDCGSTVVGFPIYGFNWVGGRIASNGQHGLVLTNAKYNRVSDAIISGNGTTAASTYHGIAFDNSDANIVTGNYFYDYKDTVQTDRTFRGINFNATSDSNYVYGNFFQAGTMTPVVDAGTVNTRVHNFYGTEAELALKSNSFIYFDDYASNWYMGYNGTQLAMIANNIQVFDVTASRVRVASVPFSIGHNVPQHELSMYQAAPDIVQTDTDVNLNVSSTAQATDSSANWIGVNASQPFFSQVSTTGNSYTQSVATTGEPSFAAGGITVYPTENVIGAATAHTLAAAGSVTITSPNAVLDTFGSAALDTAVTLTGYAAGQIVIIRTSNDGRDIRFLDSGNFELGAERLLDGNSDILALLATSTTAFLELFFISNE
jgi:hypothetical protein